MAAPKSFTNLVNNLTMLPGVGEKTAERYAFSLLERDNAEIDTLVSSLIEFKKNIKKCSICGSLTDNDICDICEDNYRDKKTICVVEDFKNVLFIEKTQKYNGLYHVLNGLISPIDGKNPEDLNISSLVRRINPDLNEIIIALSSSINGQITSEYLKKVLDKKNVKVSRLSYGIPMGGDIEYLDPIMISKAWEDRKEL